MSTEKFSKTGFLRAYALPLILMMMIPGAGWWFANHAVGKYDTRVRDGAVASITQDKTLSEEERAQALEFYRTIAASTVCRGGDPELDKLAPAFGTLCDDYAQFFWMRRIAIACVVIGGFAFLFALGCVLVSLVSQRTLYASFVAGWNVLKVASLLQAIGQGTIAVLLSYWMTALWADSYYPKLIVFTGIAAVVAVWLIIKAIFKHISVVPPLDGTLLTEQMAPRFWAHVREMCQVLETEPPTHIVAGVDDNFFVTENPVILDGTVLEGRTLFVSFSLLKFMEKREADAVLAHEMAHFSGQDTHYTKKMSPMLSRYGEYLGALYQGGLSRPIFYFMLFFWALFQLSISRMSRLREFRADRIAADRTSPADMARALLKVVAYSSYRSRIERELFSENSRQEQLGIAGRVSAGFASYVSSATLGQDLGQTAFPHPFDSHPSLSARASALGAQIPEGDYGRVLLTAVQESWLADIADAEQIEQKMWKAYEDRFSAAHEESLAWRYRPDTREERVIVEKYFPSQKRVTKKSDATLVIDFEQISFSDWEAPVPYGEIKSCETRESFGRYMLTLKLHTARSKVEFNTGRFGDRNEVVACFQRYYARHLTMVEHHAARGSDATAA
ncbi:MAG TPA: M48 family metallopeptidase [Vicinamibacterales bacterium]|nr:M48 family metallopeptidase [Vicinamibacterales bacterium]